MSDFAGDKETMQLTDAELSSAKQLRRSPAPVESNPVDLDHKASQDFLVKLTAERRAKLKEVFRELKGLQEQCDLLESQHMAGIDRIQASFEHNVQPLYAKRSSVLAVENEKGFPNFWFTVMKEFRKMLSSRVGLEVEFTDLDEAALEYLKDIKYTPLDDGWKLEFFFDSKSNPYFSNPILTKEAHYTRFRGRKIYNELKGTEIQWHSGKCLTQKVVKRLNKRSLVEIPSFFNLFGRNEFCDTHNESHASQAEKPRRHIEICRCFIKILIPRPVSFYKEHMFRHHKFNQMGTDDPKFELNIQRLEASMLADKKAAQEVYVVSVEPLYDRRSALIADILVGESTPIAFPNSADEIMLGFWLNALRGEETLGVMISDQDAMVLLYLKDIRFSYLAERKGWKLEFFFVPNRYFKNSVLTKEIHSLPSNGLCKTFNSTGTEIKWHPDGFLAVDNGQPIESFFKLFNGCGDDGYSNEDLTRDLNICNTIRRRIIPHAVSFYFDQI